MEFRRGFRRIKNKIMQSFIFNTDKWMFLYSLDSEGAITGNFSYQFLPANTNVDTGQEFADFFDTETDLANRVNELLGANYYETHRQFQWYLQYSIVDNQLTEHDYGYLPLDFIPTMDIFEPFETELQMIQAVNDLLEQYQDI